MPTWNYFEIKFTLLVNLCIHTYILFPFVILSSRNTVFIIPNACKISVHMQN